MDCDGVVLGHEMKRWNGLVMTCLFEYFFLQCLVQNISLFSFLYLFCSMSVPFMDTQGSNCLVLSFFLFFLVC